MRDFFKGLCRRFGRSLVQVINAPSTILVERDLKVPMRDGVCLAANVFKPLKSGKYPVVLSTSPYGKDLMAKRLFGFLSIPPFQYLLMQRLKGRNPGQFTLSTYCGWENPDPAFWVNQGYVVVYADMRGFFKSEGDKGEVLSPQATADYYDLIEWVAEQAWCDGHVGLNGVSYLAISQWYVAAERPPHLKAIIPWEGFTDLYRDIAFLGGVKQPGFIAFWTRALSMIEKLHHKKFVNFASELDKRPLFDAWWAERAVALENINVPALVCGSWSDMNMHTRGSFEGYMRIASKDKWLYTHGQPKWGTYYGEKALALQLTFFDYFLKNKDNGMLDMPKVHLHIRESLNVYHERGEHEWPLARTQYTPFYLNINNNQLTVDIPTESASVVYPALTGSVSFSYIFNEDTEITGHTVLKLYVSVQDADDMDLFISLQKLDNKGQEVKFYGSMGYEEEYVSRGWLRVSKRELDVERSTSWKPFYTFKSAQTLQPNEIVPVYIEILPSSTLFRKGDCLTLVIQGSSLRHQWPYAFSTINRGQHVIYAGGKYDAYLQLPIIPKMLGNARN